MPFNLLNSCILWKTKASSSYENNKTGFSYTCLKSTFEAATTTILRTQESGCSREVATTPGGRDVI